MDITPREQWSGLRVVTPPVGRPVTLAQVKQQLHYVHTQQDAVLEGLIDAATDFVTEDLSRSLVQRELEIALPAFPDGPILLPYSPAISIVSVRYTSADGTDELLDSALYSADLLDEPGRIYPAPNASWPATQGRPGAVRVRYQSGYPAVDGDPGALIPAAIRQAIVLLVGHWDANREAVASTALAPAPLAYDAIISLYRIRALR